MHHPTQLLWNQVLCREASKPPETHLVACAKGSHADLTWAALNCCREEGMLSRGPEGPWVGGDWQGPP